MIIICNTQSSIFYLCLHLHMNECLIKYRVFKNKLYRFNVFISINTGSSLQRRSTCRIFLANVLNVGFMDLNVCLKTENVRK